MSTKTNFKRVALVAVAALGLGLISSVPSNAAVDQIVFSDVTAGTGTPAFATTEPTRSVGDTTTAATFVITAMMNVNMDSLQLELVPKSALAQSTSISANLDLVDTRAIGTYVDSFIVTQSTAGDVALTQGQTARNTRTTALITAGTGRSLKTNGTRDETVGVTNGVKTTAVRQMALDTNVVTAGTGFISAKYRVSLDTTASQANFPVGTYTYTVIARSMEGTTRATNAANAAKTQYQDVSIVIALTSAAAALAATASSAGTSNIVLSGIGSSLTVAENAGTSVLDSSVAAVATASSTNAAYVRVRLRNASSGNSQESVTATITAGQIGTASIRGRSVTVPYTTADVTAGFIDLSITPDGTTGTATITVSTPSVTFTQKTMSFFATSAKTLTSTVAHPVLGIGSNSGAVRTTGVDAGGTAWAGTAYIYASSAADALIASSVTPVACTWDAANARHNCPVTGNTAGTAKLKVIDASTVATATATSNEISVTVSVATPATVKITFDKTSYAPNERARVYVTPVDSAGKEIAANTFANLFASGGITANAGFSGTSDIITGVSITTSASSSSITGAKAGALMYTLYMPSAGGTVTLTATGGTSLPAAGQVVITSTVTVADSAAAALAAVSALATTVASLKTLITTLTNLVLKIQKKVKA